VIEAIATLMAVVGIVSTLSLDTAAGRSYYDYDSEHAAERRIVLTSAFWPIVIWSTALAAVLLAARGPISRVLFGSERYTTVIALAVVALPIGAASTFFLEVMRLRHQPGRYVLVSWFGAISSVVLILYLVAVEDRGLEGFYLAGVLSAVPTLALAIATARGAVGLRFSRAEFRTMLAYALPLIPVAATAWVLQFADRFFLLRFASLDDLGLYALGVRLSNVLLLAVTAFAFAWSPFIFELFSRDPDREHDVRVRALNYVALAVGFGAVCIAVFSREFFRTVTDPAFEGAYKVVGILCAGIAAIALSSVTTTGIMIVRRTRFIAQYAFYSAAFNMALNFALIPPLGIVGAALATSAAYVLQTWLLYRRAQRLDPVPFDIQHALTALGIAGVLVAVGTFIFFEPIWLSAAVKVPLVLAYPALAWALGCIDDRALSFFRVRGPRGNFAS
jgi:O-antigen/teichoic acid export membrane protein